MSNTCANRPVVNVSEPLASAGLDCAEQRSIDELISRGDAVMLIEAAICVAFCPYQISMTSEILSNGN